jgi:hypothetical protein
LSIFIIIIIAVFIVFLFVGILNQGQRRDAWQAFAKGHDLEFERGNWAVQPSMSGRYRGVPIEIDIEMRGSGKARHPYTRVTGHFNTAMPAGMNVFQEGFGDRVAKLLGGQDIQVGVAAVDQALRIKGSDEEGVRRLFQDGRVQTVVTGFVSVHHEASVTAHRVTALVGGFVTDQGKLEGLMKNVSRVVRELEAAQSRVQPQSEVPPQHPKPPQAERSAPSAAAAEEAEAAAAEAAAAAEETAAAAEETAAAAAEAEAAVAEAEAAVAEAEAAAPVKETKPAAVEAPPPHEMGPAKKSQETFAAISALADTSAGLARRNEQLEVLKGSRVEMNVRVDRVERTSGFDVPDPFRDGRTLVGFITDEQSVAVRFPESQNETLQKMSAGDIQPICAVLADWDGLYKRPVFQVEIEERNKE